jgi:hypothetical protein
LYLLDVDGTDAAPITPAGSLAEGASWAMAPDGGSVCLARGGSLVLYPLNGGPTRQVPGGTGRDRLIGWIESGLLTSEAPLHGGTVNRIDPATGKRDVWRTFQPTDPTGIMHLNLLFLVVTPDGRSYGYTWHRAISDLYLVDGLG